MTKGLWSTVVRATSQPSTEPSVANRKWKVRRATETETAVGVLVKLNEQCETRRHLLRHKDTHTHTPGYAGTSFAYISNQSVLSIEHLFFYEPGTDRRSMKRKKKWTLTFMSAQDKTVRNVNYCKCHKGTTKELAINTKTFLFVFRFRCWLTCIFSKYSANKLQKHVAQESFLLCGEEPGRKHLFFPFTTYMIW